MDHRVRGAAALLVSGLTDDYPSHRTSLMVSILPGLSPARLEVVPTSPLGASRGLPHPNALGLHLVTRVAGDFVGGVKIPNLLFAKMVGAIGFEPTTPTMSRWCSTTELRA